MTATMSDKLTHKAYIVNRMVCFMTMKSNTSK